MSNRAYLALILDAPLMSWGHSSRFQRRTTALHPTRSGILGMICAALGVDKGSQAEKAWLQRLDPVRVTALRLWRVDERTGRRVEVRRLEDFHTVLDTRNAENKIKRDAVISHRQYLMDARFGVILEGDRSVLEPVAEALQDPRWGVWFGRKSCLPAAPILRGGGALSDVAAAMAALGLTGRKPDEFTRIEDAASFAEGSDTLMDVPLDFRTREFRPRRVANLTGSQE